MPLTNRSTLSSFDAEGVLRAVEETVSGPLYSFCEYDTESFRPIFVSDEAVAMYEDREAMVEHFELIHGHVHMDFMQIQLFRNTLFPGAERVEYIATSMDFMKILRVYIGEEGLFVAVGPDEPVEPIVDAIKGVVGWPPNQNS
ncbi:hypothetical protein ACFQGT_05805 [Natrialbaceae archaeon GCM10025810]|uniref:hypothetical protein n=1 Tax=Halovalidus salilacus TaxID=3075124 RepID=UPI00361377E7